MVYGAAQLATDCPKQNMWPDCCCPLVSFRSSLELIEKAQPGVECADDCVATGMTLYGFNSL